MLRVLRRRIMLLVEGVPNRLQLRGHHLMLPAITRELPVDAKARHVRQHLPGIRLRRAHRMENILIRNAVLE